ncbi:MAG: 4Fe-4S binding protein [Prevotellaceae bacterium]|jgi:2-oxoglutarate ferredoxin oxidoreductase subunit delta|nr:4Fe-4S binding protein [Prevotellaceae bacterium]
MRTDKLRKIHTKHVWIDPRKCVACWKCVDACPEHVIGKVGFLWHKHIIIKNPERCIGCKKCIKTCPHEVFHEYSGDFQEILKAYLRRI